MGFATLCISVVVVSQVIGPPLCKLGLYQLVQIDNSSSTFGKETGMMKERISLLNKSPNEQSESSSLLNHDAETKKKKIEASPTTSMRRAFSYGSIPSLQEKL